MPKTFQATSICIELQSSVHLLSIMTSTYSDSCLRVLAIADVEVVEDMIELVEARYEEVAIGEAMHALMQIIPSEDVDERKRWKYIVLFQRIVEKKMKIQIQQQEDENNEVTIMVNFLVSLLNLESSFREICMFSLADIVTFWWDECKEADMDNQYRRNQHKKFLQDGNAKIVLMCL